MTETQLLIKMKAPGDSRGKAIWGVIQILVTDKCDLGKCSNCTQMIPYRTGQYFISVDGFAKAVKALEGYPGVIGLMGGNPCLHPKFESLVACLAASFPKEQCGLWTNNLNGHGDLVREKLGYFNFNVHGNKAWAQEMNRTNPAQQVFGLTKKCWHGAVSVDMSIFIPDAQARNDLIAACDINQKWSAAVVETSDGLKGFFCEVAAARACVFKGENLGIDASEKDWWKLGMWRFKKQVQAFCHCCGVPLRLKGHEDLPGVDDVNGDFIQLASQAGRKFSECSEISKVSSELTDYLRIRSR